VNFRFQLYVRQIAEYAQYFEWSLVVAFDDEFRRAIQCSTGVTIEL
jgi:hypothetical protein